MSSLHNDTNFFKIWRNLYLNNLLFHYLKLYKNNREMIFYSISHIKDYKEIEYVTKLEYRGSELFECGDLPLYSNTLETISFISHFKMDNSVIPDSVTSIKYPGSYCYCCTTTYAKESMSSFAKDPKSIKSIIDPYIEQITATTFWCALEYLHFNPFFNGSISKGILPRQLKTLIFGELWRNNDETLKINDLPPSLTELNLGCYNQVLKVGLIPDKVIKLTMNQHPIYGIQANIIPNSVKYLEITYDRIREEHFNRQHCGPRGSPSLLESLKMGNILNSMGSLLSNVSLSFSIPSSVTSLEFGNYYHNKITKGMIPTTIKTLYISSTENEFSIDQDALSSTNITGFIVQYWNPTSIKAGFFPSTITYLNLGHEFSHPLVKDLLPNGLKLLKYGSNPQQYIENNPNTIIPKGTKVEINYFNNFKKLI